MVGSQSGFGVAKNVNTFIDVFLGSILSIAVDVHGAKKMPDAFADLCCKEV